MSTVKHIRTRIRAASNISQITRAMEVVSATKMRRAQAFALSARPYAVASLEILQNLLSRTIELPPLLKGRPVKTAALVVVTADKGLAGAFNANVLRRASEWLLESRSRNATYRLVTVGKKSKDYFERRREPIARSFTEFGDSSTLEETLPVADVLIEGFFEGLWDEVDAVYTNFRTTLLQETVLRRILPASVESIQDAVAAILPERGKFAQAPETREDVRYTYEYLFEPSPVEILNVLVPQLIRMHVHHLILESNASEHSARMVAMKNASDNASDLIRDLTLAYNKVRQSGITREIVEVTAGKEALER